MAMLLVTTAVVFSDETDAVPTAPTNVVKNANDSGNDSLRDVIAFAADGDTIYFDPIIDWVANPIILTSEISFSQRNITINGNDAAGESLGVVINADGKGRALLSNATTGLLTLISITIENGKVTGDGGGLYATSNLKLVECVFTGNTVTNGSGGGVYAYDKLEMYGCSFTDNAVGGTTGNRSGGGAYVRSGDITIENCSFVNNTAISCGGFNTASSGVLTMTDCAFRDNKANGYGMTDGTGGLAGPTGGSIIKGTIFERNVAYQSTGGAVALRGSNVLTDCVFIGNRVEVGSGGGIYTTGTGNMSLTNCVFADNYAGTTGGSIYARTLTSLIMINCTITGNITDGINNIGNIDVAYNTYIFHSTITGNTGPGVYVYYTSTGDKKAYLYNCIVTGNFDRWGRPMQTEVFTASGFIDTTTGNNLIEGQPVPAEPSFNVTERMVFGLNEFDPNTGIRNVLINGIANGTADAITAADIAAYGLDTAAILAALSIDQEHKPRSSSGAVTYGAVETSARYLLSIAVNDQPTKTEYWIDEIIDLSGTTLALEYSNGNEIVDYDEMGVTNNSASADMGIKGTKIIDFFFLDKSTVPTVGAEITVIGYDSATVLTVDTASPAERGTAITFTATVGPTVSGKTPTGTVTFKDGVKILGTAALDASGIAVFTVSSLSVGSHSITAVYAGDNCFYASTSNTIIFVITEGTPPPGGGDKGGDGEKGDAKDDKGDDKKETDAGDAEIVTGNDNLWLWVIVILIILFCLFLFFIIWRRRKKDEEEDGKPQ